MTVRSIVIIAMRLVPYGALSLSLFCFLLLLPQSREYLALIGEASDNGRLSVIGPRYAAVAAYYLLFCFLTGKSFQDAASDQAPLLASRMARLTLRALFVAIVFLPVGVALWLLLGANHGTPDVKLLMVGLGLLTFIGAIFISLKTARPAPGGGGSPEPYFHGASLALCLALIAVLFAVMLWNIVEASHFFGSIGVITAALAALQGGFLLLGHWRSRGYPVFSTLFALLILSQMAAVFWPGTRAVAPTPASPTPPPQAKEGFEAWLEARRPQIAARKERGGKYPVFVVAAQGGGYYAAYHAALFLARLEDRCPQFADHLFAISSVSGGSLGSAVFAEAARLRSEGFARDGLGGEPDCSAAPVPNGETEGLVRSFFNYDFLTPLVAGALLFDLPSAVTPGVHIGPDRGEALQKSFEAAWRQAANGASARHGLGQSFYGRWRADQPVPALFLNATSVNLGVPQLISELDLRAPSKYGAIASFVAEREKTGELGEDAPVVRWLQKRLGVSQRPFVNTLEFNPSINFPLSFAVASSARFPYVTPTSLIEAAPTEADSPWRGMRYAQLLDGGMADNSGLFTASEILRVMRRAVDGEKFRDLKDGLSIQLISFSHDASALYPLGDGGPTAEIAAPLAAFDQIRMSRRSSYQALADDFDRVHEAVLFDGAFNAPLSWSLSGATRGEIEKRSGGLEEEARSEERTICCVLSAGPGAGEVLKRFASDLTMALDDRDARALRAKADPGGKLAYRRYAPNAGSYAGVLEQLGFKRR
jgi:hypothetical protein